MSGRLRVVPVGESLDKHTHTLFDLDDGRQLRFQDVRKFGRIYLVDDLRQVTAGLGPEPLSEDFTLAVFRQILARRSGRLKSLLMNQQFIAGLGNIYADECLFASGLHPLRTADSLSAGEQERLYRAIRSILQAAVDRRGTTLGDGGYRDAEGRAGAFQSRIAVYARRGQPCTTCNTPIERLLIGGRSSHFCPRCQE
jgi:formamidopyrimidine-DNA glycosylase